jgi:hypothetical protein
MLQNPHPRHQLSGRTGKSTLINKTLLKEDVLFTDPSEATAVPTEIEYRPAPGTLEIYPRLFQPAKDEAGGASPMPSGEGEPRRIENPKTEDLKRETSDPTPEGRAAKATKTARVRLLWPADGLKGFTVVDTPGIDATNLAVVTTTYRVIPEADATIYVKTPKDLDQIDVDFLRSHVFDAGVSRMMVAISYDPALGRKSPENLAAICEAINAKLAEIGRPNIPVRVMQLDDTAKFEAILQNFVRENVQPGRLERCQAVVRKQLQQALTECDVELAALKKSPSEVARLEAEVAKKAEEFEENYQRLMEGFLLDLAAIQSEHYLSISERLDKVAENFIAGFEKCTSLNLHISYLT